LADRLRRLQWVTSDLGVVFKVMSFGLIRRYHCSPKSLKNYTPNLNLSPVFASKVVYLPVFATESLLAALHRAQNFVRIAARRPPRLFGPGGALTA
jgi:hypothetical protein